MVTFSAESVSGGTITQRPALGEELTVMTRNGDHINIGQVKSAAYEEGGGSGFIVQATRIAHDQSVYVMLDNRKLAIPLIWS